MFFRTAIFGNSYMHRVWIVVLVGIVAVGATNPTVSSLCIAADVDDDGRTVPAILHVTRPLAMRIEGDIAVSPFFLRYTEQRFAPQPASVSLAHAAVGSPEQVLSQVIDAINRDDAQQLAKISDNIPEQDVAKFLTLIKRSLNTTDPVVDRCLLLGGVRYYVLRGNNPQQRYVQLVLVKRKSKYVHSLAVLGDPTIAAVSLMLKAMFISPADYEVAKGNKFTHGVSLMPLFGDRQTNSVEIVFNGCETAYYPLSPPPEALHGFVGELSDCERKHFKELTFYGKVLRDLEEDRVDSAAKAFSTGSLARMGDPMKDRDQLQLFKLWMLNPKPIALTVSNDSVLLAYRASGTAITIQTAENADPPWRIVNLRRTMALDQLLRAKQVIQRSLENRKVGG